MKESVIFMLKPNFTELRNARNILSKYDIKAVNIVKECLKEQNNAISDYYTNEDNYADFPLSEKLNDILTGYEMSAYEECEISFEDFSLIYQALDCIDTYHDAQAVC